MLKLDLNAVAWINQNVIDLFLWGNWVKQKKVELRWYCSLHPGILSDSCTICDSLRCVNVLLPWQCQIRAACSFIHCS